MRSGDAPKEKKKNLAFFASTYRKWPHMAGTPEKPWKEVLKR
jgi:hypothetical protein